jgi:hypothetical protein
MCGRPPVPTFVQVSAKYLAEVGGRLCLLCGHTDRSTSDICPGPMESTLYRPADKARAPFFPHATLFSHATEKTHVAILVQSRNVPEIEQKLPTANVLT